MIDMKKQTTSVTGYSSRLCFVILNIFIYLFCILLDSYDIISRIITSSDKQFAIFKTRLPWPLLIFEVSLCILGSHFVLKRDYSKNLRIQLFIIILYLFYFAVNIVYSLCHFSLF